MEAVLSALAAVGIKLGVLFSSAVGGFLSLRFFEGDKLPDGTVRPLTVRQKWFIAAAGWAMGIYMAGLTVELFGLTDKTGKVEIGLGLVIAAFGMSLASAINRAIRELNLGPIIESWLRRPGR